MASPPDLHRAHCAVCAEEVAGADLRECRRCRRTFHLACCDRRHEEVLHEGTLTGVCLLCSSGLGLRMPPPPSRPPPHPGT